MNSQRIEREEARSGVFYFCGQESPCQPPAKHLTVAIRHLGAEIVPFGVTFVTKTGITSKIKTKIAVWPIMEEGGANVKKSKKGIRYED